MSNMSDLTTVTKIHRKGEFAIRVTTETAAMLLELVSKSAVSGVQAHLLAELYAQANLAVRALENERDDEP